MRAGIIRHAAIGAAGLGLVALASCGEPAARSADYFAAHEGEARAIVDNCTAGTSRGAECDNAREGLRVIAGKRAFQPAKVPTTDGKGY